MVRNWLAHLALMFRTRKGVAFFGLLISVFALTASLATPFGTANAQSSPLTNNLSTFAQFGNTEGLSSGYGSNTSTCAIETVGWVICPVMRSIAKLADYGFAFINQNFLRIEYNIQANDGGVYKAWELVRNVANALFVLAFMIIIYSQITGRGGGGYNIKRMLPKLIIAVIMVNVSYYACAAVIDVSNILGDSVLAIMKGVADQVGQAAMSLDSAENGFEDSRLSDITSSVLTKSGTVWILLAPVAAVTIAIAIICGAGLVLLIMRKVVVAMLVLASPLIFVAYLLPNLERAFQQWIRLFLQLLILYPIIAFLLGTGQIISATIVNVDSGSDADYSVRDDSYQARNGGSGHITTDLAAAGAAVLPLLGVWFLLKNLTTLATNAGGKLADFRRGNTKEQDEKIKAKLDSKQNQPKLAGAASGLPTYDRRPAFSRLSRKRKASSGGSALGSRTGGSSTGTPSGAGRAASGNNPASVLDSMLGLGKGDKKGEAASDAAKKLEDANNQAASAEAANLNAQVAAAVQSGDDKKGKSAKDIFNNMNKTHQSKDQQRSLGAGGPQPAGQQGGQAAPSAPSSDYRAPQIMQNRNSSGPAAPAPQAGAAPQIIAVPVQVDASSFLQQPPQPQDAAARTNGMIQPPTSDIERKASARAQKYIFDSTTDVEAAEAKLDMIKELQKENKQNPPQTPEQKDKQ